VILISESKIQRARATLTFLSEKWGLSVTHARENISSKFELSASFICGVMGLNRTLAMLHVSRYRKVSILDFVEAKGG